MIMEGLIRKGVTWFYSRSFVFRYVFGLFLLSLFYFSLLDFVLHVYFYYKFTFQGFSEGGLGYKLMEFFLAFILAFATLSVTSFTGGLVGHRVYSKDSIASSDEKFHQFEYRVDALSRVLDMREKALKEQHKQRGALLDAIPDLILQLDYQGNVKSWSDSTEDFSLLFYDIDQKNILDFLPDKVVSYCFDNINRALNSGKTQVFEFDITYEEEVYIFEARVSKIDEFNVMMIFRNLTDVRFLEKQKTRQANMFKHMADNLPEMFWSKDNQDRYVFINKRYREFLFEGSSVNILGNVISTDFTNEETVRNIKESDSLVRNNRVSLRFLIKHIRSNGSDLWLDVYKSPWWSNSHPNQMVGTVGSARDITDCMPDTVKKKLNDISMVEVSFDQCFHWSSIDPACNECISNSEVEK